MTQSKPQIFKPKINPALHRHAAEAAIIGRIVVGFGELEYIMVDCANSFFNGALLRALYRTRSTSARIDAADAIIAPRISGSKYEYMYRTMLIALRYCLSIRNQYAHCNFADHPDGGLFFVDLENFARQSDSSVMRFVHVDENLLQRQEDFFVYTQDMLYFLRNIIVYRDNPERKQPYPIPIERKQPPLYNPPSKHVPPWFDEAQQGQHLAWAIASEGGKPTPTAGHQKLEAEKAAKKARLAENRRKSAAGELQTKSPDGT